MATVCIIEGAHGHSFHSVKLVLLVRQIFPVDITEIKAIKVKLVWTLEIQRELGFD